VHPARQLQPAPNEPRAAAVAAGAALAALAAVAASAPKPPPPPNWPPPLPGVPPLATDKQSRLLFLDLTDELLAEVRGPTGTAFIPESARIMRSGYYKFFDEPYISAVHLTQKSCPFLADDGLSNFETNQSRSEVNFDARSAPLEPRPHLGAPPLTRFDARFDARFCRGAQVDETKPNCALLQPTKGHTMIQLDGTCATEVVADELIEGFSFEPRCLVVVLAVENEKTMFESMMSAGRILTDPFVS